MRRSTFMLALLACFPASVPAVDRLQVLSPGDYGAGEMDHRTRQDWLALVSSHPGEARLLPVRLGFQWIYDALSDPDPRGPYSGLRVATRPHVNASILLNGGGLRAGPLTVATMTSGQASGLEEKRLSLEGTGYRLNGLHDCVAAGRDWGHCHWALSDGKRTQVLVQFRVDLKASGGFVSRANIGMLWAGDLDHDGRLDLVLDVRDHENAAVDIQVFLSSQAAKGDLVGAAARFEASGC